MKRLIAIIIVSAVMSIYLTLAIQTDINLSDIFFMYLALCLSYILPVVYSIAFEPKEDQWTIPISMIMLVASVTNFINSDHPFIGFSNLIIMLCYTVYLLRFLYNSNKIINIIKDDRSNLLKGITKSGKQYDLLGEFKEGETLDYNNIEFIQTLDKDLNIKKFLIMKK